MKIMKIKLLTGVISMLLIISTSFLISCGKTGALYLVDENGNKIERNYGEYNE